MIIDKIKAQNLEAIKTRNSNARAIYGIVINKYMLLNVDKRSKGEEVTDIDVVAILQKTVKELVDEANGYAKVGNMEEKVKIDEQKNIISQFLPQMLAETEIKDIIMSLPDRTIPTVMKHFKANFAGKCDMGLVQKVLKEL